MVELAFLAIMVYNSTMKSSEIVPVTLPEHLLPTTIENMPLDKAYFIEPSNILLSSDNRLWLNGNAEIDDDARYPESVYGSVAIVRTTNVVAETNEIQDVFIADFRYAEDEESRLEFKQADYRYDELHTGDEEDDIRAQQDAIHQLPIAAIVIKDIDGAGALIVGDKAFTDVALQLAGHVDDQERISEAYLAAMEDERFADEERAALEQAQIEAKKAKKQAKRRKKIAKQAVALQGKIDTAKEANNPAQVIFSDTL